MLKRVALITYVEVDDEWDEDEATELALESMMQGDFDVEVQNV